MRRSGRNTNEEINREKGALHLIGKIVPICALIVSLGALYLTWCNVNQNRKSTILAHTPWVALTGLTVEASDDDKVMTIGFVLENPSDFPALQPKAVFTVYAPANPPKDLDDHTLIGTSSVLMPKHNEPGHSFLSGNPTGQTFSAKYARDLIYAGTVTIRCHVQYLDAFGNTIKIVLDARYNPTEKIFIQDGCSISGYQTF